MTKSRDIASASPAPSTVSTTELGYLDGVTSSIQTQFSNISGSKAQPDEPSSPTDGMIWVDTNGSTTDANFIPKTLTSTTGDIIYASGANTPARLGIGSTGNVLTVSGGVPAWSAPAGGGKVLQVVSSKYSTEVSTTSVNTFVDSGLEATITPSSTSSRIIIFTVCKYINTNSADQNGIVAFRYTRSGTEIFKPFQPTNLEGVGPQAREISTLSYIDSPSSTSALTYKLQGLQKDYITSGGRSLAFQQGGADSSMILMEIGA